jgi:lysophospholipase L1-like esterase
VLTGNPAADGSLAASPPAKLGMVQTDEEHRNQTNLAAGNPCNLVLLGDSITDQIGTVGQSVWNADYAPLGTLNLAITGLSSAEVRWQVEQGQVAQAKPRVVQLMIGTNDLGLYQRDPVQVATTVADTIGILQSQLPTVKVLIVGVLPRFDGKVPPQRIAQLNALYAQIADGIRIWFVNPGQAFVGLGGRPGAALYQPDRLHLTVDGDAVLWQQTSPLLRQMLAV